MRIRKHLSRIAFTGGITTTATSSAAAIFIPSSSTSTCKRGSENNLQQTQLCELNRSPWDVIDFSPLIFSDLYFPPLQYQVVFRREDENGGDNSSVTENTIDDESVIAFKSISSLKEEEKESEDEDEKRFSLLVDVEEEKKLGFVFCNKTDGKGWKCGREAKRGHSLCEHHITQLRSYHYASRKTHTIKASAISSGRQRRNKSRLSKPGTDFYYYSGFGPLWGKKRRGEGNDNPPLMKKEKDGDEEIQIQRTEKQITLSYVDFDEDIEEDDDGEKRRIRKPIKERSLKSLF